ncbi:MAG: aminotransferase class IV [Isosphaeraceae bacterium]
MIWIGGKVVSSDELRVSVLDRTFEHGLGLFETLRTWDRKAPLLDRHMERLSRAAKELGLPLDPAALPTQADVESLLDARGEEGDFLLRVTTSGGLNASNRMHTWMYASPLPPPLRREGAIVDLGSWKVLPEDPLARFKSLNYWGRRLAFERAQNLGFDETLGVSGPIGARVVWEGSRTNLFAVQDGRLTTPAASGPLVPGVMRRLVLERAAEFPLEVAIERIVPLTSLLDADELFLTNSVRGVIPVARLHDAEGKFEPIDWSAPGHWTRTLAIAVRDWVTTQGNAK